MSRAARPLVIGWKEHVAFPEWGIRRVRAKIDTGARTSALDVVGYQLSHDGRGLRAQLHLALSRRSLGRLKVVEVPVLELVKVRCSNGSCEERPLIEAEVRLGPVTKRIRLTVTNRATMRYRMILGRQALAGDFIVDVGRRYLLSSK